MRNLFIGYLFIFLNFNLNFDEHIVALLPTFIGYYFMVKGLDELAGESLNFTKIRPYAVGMGIYNGFLFVMDILGITMDLGITSWILGLVVMAISLYISYIIILGIKDIEAIYCANLESEKLRTVWSGMAIIQVLAQVLVWAPAFVGMCVIVLFILTILYLVAFNNAKKIYEALPKTSVASEEIDE